MSTSGRGGPEEDGHDRHDERDGHVRVDVSGNVDADLCEEGGHNVGRRAHVDRDAATPSLLPATRAAPPADADGAPSLSPDDIVVVHVAPPAGDAAASPHDVHAIAQGASAASTTTTTTTTSSTTTPTIATPTPTADDKRDAAREQLAAAVEDGTRAAHAVDRIVLKDGTSAVVIPMRKRDKLIKTLFGFTFYFRCEIDDEVRMTLWILGTIAAIAVLGFFIADVDLHSVSDDDLELQERQIGLIIGGIFAFLATILSIIQIRMHYAHWKHPPSQRCVVRILLMVPIYSISSFLSLLVLKWALYFDFLRSCYEAFVIFSFMILLTKYLGGHDGVAEWMKHKPRLGWPEPLCCLPPVQPNSQFLYWLKYGTLQYTIIAPVVSVLAVVLEFMPGDQYGNGTIDWSKGYVYLAIVQNFSQLTSLFALVWLYSAMRNELAPFSPLAKFLVVKSVVFVTWWQSIGLSIMVSQGVINSTSNFDVGDVQVGLQSFLVCIEMFIAAAVHKYTFGHETYKSGLIITLMEERRGQLAKIQKQREEDERLRQERLQEEARRLMAGLRPRRRKRGPLKVGMGDLAFAGGSIGGSANNSSFSSPRGLPSSVGGGGDGTNADSAAVAGAAGGSDHASGHADGSAAHARGDYAGMGGGPSPTAPGAGGAAPADVSELYVPKRRGLTSAFAFAAAFSHRDHRPRDRSAGSSSIVSPADAQSPMIDVRQVDGSGGGGGDAAASGGTHARQGSLLSYGRSAIENLHMNAFSLIAGTGKAIVGTAKGTAKAVTNFLVDDDDDVLVRDPAPTSSSTSSASSAAHSTWKSSMSAISFAQKARRSSKHVPLPTLPSASSREGDDYDEDDEDDDDDDRDDGHGAEHAKGDEPALSAAVAASEGGCESPDRTANARAHLQSAIASSTASAEAVSEEVDALTSGNGRFV